MGNYSLTGSKTPGFKTVKFMPMHKGLLISGANDGSVTVWDIFAKDQLVNYSCQHNSKVNSISCSPFN